MAELIGFKLDTSELRRNLKLLADREIPRWAARTLTKVAFEIRDAERQHAGEVFKFAGASTEQFFTGKTAFRVDGAKPDRLVASVYPAPKTGAIIEQHQRGATIRAGEERLSAQGMLAIPLEAKRGARGRIRKAQLPSTVLGRGGRGFRIGRVIVQRKSKRRRSGLRALFALVPQAKLKPRFDFYRVAKETAEREFPRKAKREFERIKLPQGR